MNPKLTPSAVSLALSASATVVGGNQFPSAGDVVISPDRLVDGTEVNTHQRRVKAEQIDHNNVDIGGSNIDVDVGILSGYNDGSRRNGNKFTFQRQPRGFGMSSRFLQEEVPTCSYPETCEPNLCACTANGGTGNPGYECAAELNAVCNKVTDVNGTTWSIAGCVGNVKYYRKVWCPFAECIVNGGTYATCYCEMYQTVCDIYGDRQKYENETTTVQSCAAAACCQTKTDEDGRKSCFVTSTGQSLSSWDGVRATSLAATVVAWSIFG